MLKTVELKQVRVKHSRGNIAPSTSSVPYRERVYVGADMRFVVQEFGYFVQTAFARAGEPPTIDDEVDNTRLPNQRLLDQFVSDLTSFSKDGCSVIVWEDASCCYQPVAEHLPKLFRLAVLTFADDCPGSSEIKTFPVARYFNALIYSMFTRDSATGARTAIEYQTRGIPYCCFRPNQITTGLDKYVVDHCFDVEEKIARFARGFSSHEIAFVGVSWVPGRMSLVGSVAANRAKLAAEGVSIRLHGVGMPDGPLLPRDPPHPLGLGYPLGDVYAEAAYGFNIPVSSLFNCRFVDLYEMGVLPFMHDRHGELAEFDFLPEEHYAAYDGTPASFLARLRVAKADPLGSAAILRRGRARLKIFLEETSEARTYADIYAAHVDQLLGGPRRPVWRSQ